MLSLLPQVPGVYKYLDEHGKIIYIGKAKNLRKRVSSYFHKNHQVKRIEIMVKHIETIEYVVVDSEVDALLLENNLIKKHQPRYNILLKDDKSFPWICITKEAFPRVFKTRKRIKDGSRYYGPFASVMVADALLELVQNIYPLHTARYKVDMQNYPRSIFRNRLEHHIKNLDIDLVNSQDAAKIYQEIISEVDRIFRGNLRMIEDKMKDQMISFAKHLAFEQANFLKQKVLLLQKYQSKSIIVSPMIDDVDVYSFLEDGNRMFVNALHIKSGAIIHSYTLETKNTEGVATRDTFIHTILFMREKMCSLSKEVITPIPILYDVEGIKFVQPKIGDKKKLLELSFKNAQYFRDEKIKKQQLLDPERHTRELLAKMQSDLGLPQPPVHIECFDNSNIQGAYPVSACVVFRDARPSKSEYRHFNIKTVEGIDDFQSMREVVFRRYRRLISEGLPLPQLIVIDGGKGQLSSALQVLTQLGIQHRVGLISIAKRLEEIYRPDDPMPLYLDKKSETLRVIQHLRNEAHRFGITHHRKKRRRSNLKTELYQIPDIGEKTSLKLLSVFGSVESLSRASLSDLISCVGKVRAEKIHRFFQKK